MPPTPGASEGEYSRSGSVSESEYVLVEGEKRADFDSGEDGDMPPPPPLKNVRHEAEEDENEEDSE
jgi:hypothetical protein